MIFDLKERPSGFGGPFLLQQASAPLSLLLFHSVGRGASRPKRNPDLEEGFHFHSTCMDNFISFALTSVILNGDLQVFG